MSRKKKQRDILNEIANNSGITKNDLYLIIGGDRTAFFEILNEFETNNEIIVTKNGQREQLTLYPINQKCNELLGNLKHYRVPLKGYVAHFSKFQGKKLTKKDKEEIYNLGYMFCYSCKASSKSLKVMTISQVFGTKLARIAENLSTHEDKILNKILGLIYKLDPVVFERVIHNVFAEELAGMLPSKKSIIEIFKLPEMRVTKSKVLKIFELMRKSGY